MCIPHAPIANVGSIGRIKREKEVKKTISYNKEDRMKADPDFVDKRHILTKDNPVEKGWFSKLFET